MRQIGWFVEKEGKLIPNPTMPFITAAQSIASYVKAAYDPTIEGNDSTLPTSSHVLLFVVLLLMLASRQERRDYASLCIPREACSPYDRHRGGRKAVEAERRTCGREV